MVGQFDSSGVANHEPLAKVYGIFYKAETWLKHSLCIV